MENENRYFELEFKKNGVSLLRMYNIESLDEALAVVASFNYVNRIPCIPTRLNENKFEWTNETANITIFTKKNRLFPKTEYGDVENLKQWMFITEELPFGQIVNDQFQELNPILWKTLVERSTKKLGLEKQKSQKSD